MSGPSKSKGLELTSFVRRPGLGLQGRKIRVRTNFFKMESFTDDNVHHYDVTITPDVPSAINKRVFEHFQKNDAYAAKRGNVLSVYDGRKNMFSPKALPFGDTTTVDIVLPEDDGVTSSRRPPREFKLSIKKVASINMEILHQFLNNRGPHNEEVLRAIMALDMVIRYQPSIEEKYRSFARSFYIPTDPTPIIGGLEVWQGYFQSARPTKGTMMINIDVSATVFYEGGSLVNLIVRALGVRSPNDLRRGIEKWQRASLEKFLKNLKIRSTHIKRQYRIRKLSENPASRTMFESETGSMSVETYFQRKYNKRLEYPFLPCVEVRDRTFLPIEVCEVVKGQRYPRKLTDKQTADMIKITCSKPNERANKILQGYSVLNYRENEYMRQFGCKVAKEMTTVEARILRTPTITYHPTSVESKITPEGGSWTLLNKKVLVGATLGSWGVILFGTERDLPKHDLDRFLKEFVNTSTERGMNIPNKNPPINYVGRQPDTENALKQIWVRAGNLAKAEPQLLVCILFARNSPLYGEIKRIGDTVFGVSTQCLQSTNVSRANKQYCANVCLKVNVKLGGMNTALVPESIPFVSERPTLIMGADVAHPPPASSPDCPSIAACCASMDAKASRYAASIRLNQHRVEFIRDLGEMVRDLLKTFYQTCGKKPERILFYRDGVSEGQFSGVLEDELQKIKDACLSLDKQYKPKITFVVVQKRHHARFFPIDKKDSDRTGNCRPGTVVESGICHPSEFDFYIQSQSALQGTCRPCHYQVLYDENDFNADKLQALSYNLCYLQARCTRSVSLVPPVYYADILCTRGKYHMKGDWSDTGSSGCSEMASTFAPVKPKLQKVMYFM